MRIYLLLAAALSAAVSLHCQSTVPSVNNDIQLEALPYYNYGNGLGFTSPDSLFQLNIRFRMQNRASLILEEEENPAVEAMVRRLRLRFDGHVGIPSIIYAIQLSFSAGDIGTIEEGENVNIIRDAVVFWRPNENFNLGFGQTKLPGNRQRINSSGALQLTNRSINNARFNLDRDFGVHAYYLYPKENDFSFNIKTTVSTGEGRNWTGKSDDGLAYTGKLELYPFGYFAANGDKFEGDLMREPTPKLLLSGVYHYNQQARRTQGTIGDLLFRQIDLRSYFFDIMFKYQGLSLMGAYMARGTEDPITLSPEDSTHSRWEYIGHGWDAQASYIFPGDFETIVRYSWQTPYLDITDLTTKRQQYSIGLTKYIWEHALKLQTEFTYTSSENKAGNQTGFFYTRFQLELGI